MTHEHKTHKWWQIFRGAGHGNWPCGAQVEIKSTGEAHECVERSGHGPHHKCECNFRWLA